MTDQYFKRVNYNSQTRFWINNPTLAEADLAIHAGAVGCTTNPTYAAKMLSSGESVSAVLEDAGKEHTTPEEQAAHVQRQLAARIMKKFLPLYDKSEGSSGFVSIQGDPFAEHDPDGIVAEAMLGRELGPNFIAKIPVSTEGLDAISRLVTLNVPVIATEIMSVSQAIAACEAYQRAADQSSHRPAFFVTHITGIFDEFLAQYVADNNIDISRDVLWYAGVTIARKQHGIMKERGYPGVLLGGGARDLHHFTEFVGSDAHITINWKGTADRLIEIDPPVVYRFDSPVPNTYLDELLEKLPVFRMAYFANDLAIPDFAAFGPVAYFRDKFKTGWQALLDRLGGNRST